MTTQMNGRSSWGSVGILEDATITLSQANYDVVKTGQQLYTVIHDVVILSVVKVPPLFTLRVYEPTPIRYPLSLCVYLLHLLLPVYIVDLCI